jgi:hypothetical protein
LAAINFLSGATGYGLDSVAHAVILAISAIPDVLAVLLLLAAGYSRRTARTATVKARKAPVKRRKAPVKRRKASTTKRRKVLGKGLADLEANEKVVPMRRDLGTVAVG